MVMKVVWCLFIPLFLSGIRSSPTNRETYGLKIVENDDVQDAEPAETNTYPDPYSESRNDASEDSSEDPPRPPDHVIPHSEHEDPGEVPTRPKYVAPGTWAKPDPKKNIPLNFVPTKSLAQVRGTHTVRVLPQSEAIAAATSAEERENAPRLRQVVSKKKTNTVYTEEGYEDSAYDHAGHIRDADFHEGYARKLHDQRQSEGRSGAALKRKKSKGRKSRIKGPAPEPDEFEEFRDDYSEEHTAPEEKYEVEESKKTGKKDAKEIHEDAWKNPEINPKNVAENEIVKLEDDLRREAEEAEKGSENYASVTDRELHRVDESQDDSSGERDDAKERPLSSKRQENFYKEDYEATTIQFETPTPRESEQYETSTLTYENPTTLKFYLPEGSDLRQDYDTATFNYGNSNDQRLVNTDVKSTANYGDIFWNYFKTKPNEPTTPYPQEKNSPVALATINGHGPYLLLSENGAVTQNPSQFEIEGTTYYPTMQSIVQNGHQYTDPYGISNSQVATARSGYEFPGFGNYGEPATSSFDNWGLKSSLEVPILSTESPTTRFYDSIAFSSTPAYSVITLPPKEYGYSDRTTSERNSNGGGKPLVNSVREAVNKLDGYERENFDVSGQKNWPVIDDNSALRKNKMNSQNSESGVEKPLGFFNYSPNLKYTKILNYIKKQQNDKYDGQKSESAEAEDFTIMKPPTPSESVFSDFTPSSYPNVADYSSVKQESGAAKEINGKQFYPRKNGPKYNDLSQKGAHLKSAKFYGDNPQPAINRNKLFPPSKLLPPAPNSKDNYADYMPIRQPSSEYKSKFANGVKNYNPDPKNLARYFNNRRLPSRYRRSLGETVLNEEKIADAVIAREINARFNFTFEDQGSSQNHALKESQGRKSRAKRNPTPEGDRLKENSSLVEGEIFSNENEKSTIASEIRTNHSLRGKRSNQDLLDASHKIAGDVVDEEINSRFGKRRPEGAADDEEEEEGEEDEENEDEDEEVRREKQVEVEVPDFDYLDEIQDVNNIDDVPTTQAASIDPRKYPFYNNNKVDNASPLKYVINPSEIPRKTFGGMEFYESRDRYIQCDEVDPNLDEVLPEEEEPVPNRGPKENLPRLRGLGDKLDCFKAKYFGENPFDSPLFFEKRIDQPTAPSELDPVKFAARILALPEENRKYFVPAQTKKTETVNIERMDSGSQQKEGQDFAETSKVPSSTVLRGRKRYNNNYNRSKEASTQKPQSQSQRIRQRRPVPKLPSPNATEASAVKPVTPYEKEVYDDVMGTIKNLASLYEMIESQTVVPGTKTTIISPNSGRISGAPSIRNDKTLNRAPLLNGIREKNLYPSDSTEIVSHEEIEGLLPPPELNKKPKLLPYRTNKVSYNTRMRAENPPRNGDRQIIGYYRTVKVHKRSLDGDSDARSNEDENSEVLDSEFEGSRVNYRTASPDASSSSTARPNRKRKRKTNLDTTTTTTASSVSSETPSETQNGRTKPVYTVRTRSKNSRDEKTRDKYGVFTTTQRTTSAVDDRRKEPRYREIMRRRGQTAATTTTASPEKAKGVDSTESIVNPEVIESSVEQVTEPGEIYESDHSVPRRRKVSIVDPEASDEVYKAIASEFEPEDAEEDEEHLENYEDEATEAPEKSQRKYDVHEDVQEATTPSIVGFPSPVKTSDHIDLETYLSTDPPGFREAFADLPTTKTPFVSADNSAEDKDNYREEVSKEEQADDEDGEYYTLAPKNDSYQKKESSEEDDIESRKISESYKPSSSKNVDESADAQKSSELEDTDVGTFFSFNARPDSPFENFEDKKYSDLGPRINKPAFYHPHFEPEKYEEHVFDDLEIDEKKEKDKTEESSENEKYEFPWAHDEEDEKAEAREKYVDEATEKYEYPWEKRERLAEERKKRRKERERLKKLRDFSFFDDTDGYEEDEDEHKPSSSETNKKVVYPWQYYDDIPSKATKKSSWKSGGFDNEEVSSNHRPVAKFSSKYSSSKFKMPFQGSEPIAVADPKEIRKSVLNFLRDADDKSAKTDISTSLKASDESDQVMKRPSAAEKKLSPSEPLSSEPRTKKRISNSRIVPENITLAPRNANRSSVIPLRDRTTLRPSVKSTTEATASLRTQTTVTPITTTRRPLKLRGRTNVTGQRPPYATKENRVTTSTAVPTQLKSTTEKPVKSGKKKSGNVFVRKRGYLKNTVSTPKSNAQSSEDVTDRSPPAITTVRRRKLPAVTTGSPIKKTAFKDAEKAKRPSKFGPKNLAKETTYDAYRIPTMSLGNSKDRDVDNATPSRTVEHRSRVSEEEIITKTSFPDENAMYKIYRNKNMTEKNSPFGTDDNGESSTDRKPKMIYSKTPDRAKNSFATITDSPDETSAINESPEKFVTTTKETPETVYQTTEPLVSDDLEGISDSINSENHTVGPTEPEDELRTDKTPFEDDEKKNDRGYNFDEIKTQSGESKEDVRGVSAEDSSTLSQVPPKSPPGSNELKESDESSGEIVSSEEDSSTESGEGRYNSEYEESDESEEDESSEEENSSVAKFEKDPSRRLYYFLDDKK